MSQDTTITATTSGNSHVVLCDNTGWAHLVSRSWEITPFKAYELSISLAQQLPHDPLLVTIGDDEAGTNPLIKVWDWGRKDRHGNPICVRMSRAVPSHMRPTPATALAVHENKSRHLEPLVLYLEELHKKGGATEDHTTLLLTCYVKIDQHDQQGKLKEFINSKDKVIEFDVDVAIKV
ncbi:hypothetical protein MSG28_013090 [Choristoneura fumiferana]|uniref:Uncharacterized protein n=1 Tax=Choristoneura fumiferana TaxID=7141 RepID=A0ACC0KSW4_CHOFU|nr:hypothetical protein MSG28_013090 [Choristoneura fumiferana]